MLYLLQIINDRNFALLINTSKDFENYRHTTNVLTFKEILLCNGYTEKDMIVLLAEDILHNARNSEKGRIYNSETEFAEYEDLPVTRFDLNKLLNILYCNHQKMLHLDENTNLFMYMCGHGGDGFMKILGREFLQKNDLHDAILYLSKRLKNVIFFFDTCQAETLVDIEHLPKNVFVVCTSKKGQPSVSCKSNARIGCAVIDSFPKLFVDKLNEKKDLAVRLDEFLKPFLF
jgi:phosphatidylinositol glycan class K